MINKEIIAIIKRALAEDIGKKDITTLLTVPFRQEAEAVIFAKEKGVLCGINIVWEVFKQKDKKIFFKSLKKDGDTFRKDEKVAYIRGDAHIILSSERVALNFLSLLSGISTLTKKFADKIKGTGVKILDTRKTTPNLRALEKYAVRIGGGYNHRMTLAQEVLIKDNHLKAARFINKSSPCAASKRDKGKFDEERFRNSFSYLKKSAHLKIEVEVESMEVFKRVIKYKPDVVMLDNFSLAQLKKAVVQRDEYFPQVKLEVSGGINLNNVREVARAGVDFISVGMITHSPAAIDFSLEVL
ncbi:MAG: nicotinate-nucleotide diphosphorylase [Candidatus Omnitrophica bacterium]|nr:nicotinate-nucleotide diphosphorylase [Candidatus Omnitrophota bacterium]MBU2437017.1 nicotinate-nucleotide diphosphorylase [Candidatus Omnitrophota bacterium]